ncbi:MAG: hypothetical protein GY820_37225, partial [Gammaproteobacteria bacterium]|nr:hypothetical protein [Gammaproteobacteria bacterium]
MKDLEVKTIIDLLENSPQTKRSKGLIGYRMEDNVLYYTDDNGENRRIVVPVQERQKICWEHHYGPTGGHFGWKKTSLSLKSKYFWPFMSGKIKSYVRSCEICAARNGNQRRCKPKLKPLNIPEAPMDRMGMDVLKLPMSEEGHNYLLVLQDYLTKYLFAYPIERETAEVIARVLVSDFFK